MSFAYCLCFGPTPATGNEVEAPSESKKVPTEVKPSSANGLEADESLSTDGSATTVDSDEDEEVLECDYDHSVTKLYQKLEERDWEACVLYLRTGKWSTSIFAFADESPPSVQARTWVTAYEENKPDARVKWSLLPLHAAIAFNAPFDVVRELVDLYPRGVRCADDQEMLPLHTAFRFGASDMIVSLLLEEFPEALTARGGRRKRTALDMAQYGPNPQRAQIIHTYIEYAVRSARHRWDLEKNKVVRKAQERGQEAATSKFLQSKAAVNKELEVTKKRLDEKNHKVSDLTTRLAKARKELQDLRGELHVKGLQNEQKEGDEVEARSALSSRGGSILDLLGDSADDDTKVGQNVEVEQISPDPSIVVGFKRSQSFKSGAESVKESSAGFGKVFRRSRLFRRKSKNMTA
jgi:hypothetical protein